MGKRITANNILDNKKARFNYHIDKEFEAGLVLEGWEVKSLRAGRGQLTDSYAKFNRAGELFLVGMHITPLVSASTHTEARPERSRKLLLHKRELNTLIGLTEQKGYTIVALRAYWKGARVKVALGVGKGKKLYDKRADKKDKDWQRQQQRGFKHTTLKN